MELHHPHEAGRQRTKRRSNNNNTHWIELNFRNQKRKKNQRTNWNALWIESNREIHRKHVYMKEAFALKRTYALTPLIIYPLLYTRRKSLGRNSLPFKVWLCTTQNRKQAGKQARKKKYSMNSESWLTFSLDFSSQCIPPQSEESCGTQNTIQTAHHTKRSETRVLVLAIKPLDCGCMLFVYTHYKEVLYLIDNIIMEKYLSDTFQYFHRKIQKIIWEMRKKASRRIPNKRKSSKVNMLR